MGQFTKSFACFICETQFTIGDGEYGGKHIPAYDINVCNSCYQSSHDGWNLAATQRITKHLRSNGIIVPEKNGKGFLPRDGKE